LEIIFRIKQYCEECMQEIDKTKPTENPSRECASQEPHEETYTHPLFPDIQDDFPSKLDQISYLISKSDLEDIEHLDDDPYQRVNWAQSILSTSNYLSNDPANSRRMRSQFEGDPHALAASKLVMHMHSK
jgi:hypothetical protein